MRPPGHRALPIALALMGLALAIRWLAWSRTAVMHDDGPTFIGLARLMDAGEWSVAFAHPYHPLYPLAVLGAKQLGFETWEAAGAAVSVVAGSLSVGALYLLLRRAAGNAAAWVGGLTLAVQAYAVPFSADVQSDGLYLALFLAAALAAWHALENGAPRHAAVAGAVAGLAYLVRPEGLGPVVVAGGLGLGLVLRGRWRPGPAIAWACALAVGWVLVAGPYLVELRRQTGSFTLTQKKSVSPDGLHYAGLDPGVAFWGGDLRATDPFLETVVEGPRRAADPGAVPAKASGWPRLASAAKALGAAVWSTLRPELQVLLFLGLLAGWRGRGSQPSRQGLFVLGFAVLYLVVLFGLAYGAGYVSRRHVLPVAVLSFGYVGLGATLAGSWLVARGSAGLGRPLSSRRVELLGAVLGAALIAAVALPKALQERRQERLAERRAAEWLQAEWPEGAARGAVAAEKQRVAYYAGAPFVPLPSAGVEQVGRYLQATGARFLIVDDRHLERSRHLRDTARTELHVVHTARGAGGRAAVYSVPELAVP